VDPRVARGIARRSHLGQRDRFGEPVIEHVERVAARVPPEARTTALLHELLELTSIERGQLRARGLSATELAALELLTRKADEPYRAHVMAIANAPGDRGRIARLVKLADLEDHLAHSRIPPGAPPYAWARRCVLGGSEADQSIPARALTG
jgi:(p)ppGpp synthase/HD superfamily hydrolase